MTLEEEENDLLNKACCCCGIALYNMEVGADLVGFAVDYTTHERYEVELNCCTECWNKMMETLMGGMRKAIAKRRALESITQEDEHTRGSGCDG